MLTKECGRAVRRLGRLLSRLVRDDERAGLDRVCAPDRRHRDRGNPRVPDDSGQDGRRLSGVERRCASHLADRPAAISASWGSPGIGEVTDWETRNDRRGDDCPRSGCGGVRMGSPNRRIPQLLTLGGAIAGLTVHLLVGGWDAGVASAAGWAVGIAIFFVPFAFGRSRGRGRQAARCHRRLAGSDERDLGGLYAGAAGGVLAIFVALTSGYLVQAVGNVGMMLVVLAFERRQAVAGNHARTQSRSAARVCRAHPCRNHGDAMADVTTAASKNPRTASREPRRSLWRASAGPSWSSLRRVSDAAAGDLGDH